MPKKGLINLIFKFIKRIYNFFFNQSAQNQKKTNQQQNYQQNANNSQFFTNDPKYDEIKSKDNQEQMQATADQLSRNGGVRPDGYRQRNLDVEVGGLEQEERKEISSKDIWDDRSEEVDRMAIEGAKNSINTTSKRSMLWRLKKKRLDKKEQQFEEMEIAEEMSKSHASRVQQQRQNNNNSGRSL